MTRTGEPLLPWLTEAKVLEPAIHTTVYLRLLGPQVKLKNKENEKRFINDGIALV